MRKAFLACFFNYLYSDVGLLQQRGDRDASGMEVGSQQPQIADMTRHILLVLLTIWKPAAVAAEEPEITVHLYDQAGVPERTLRQAVMATTRIFAEAGVRLRWVPQAPPVARPGEGLLFRPSSSPVEVSIRLLPKRLSDLMVRRGSPKLGLTYDEGKKAYRFLATVFFDRVESAAAALYDVAAPDLLGHVMAHELGHILLGPDAHARGTIMACPWDSGDFRLLRRGQLRFTLEQAAILQGQVGGRVEEARMRGDFGGEGAPQRGGDPAGR